MFLQFLLGFSKVPVFLCHSVYKCLLKVLRPVRILITTLDCFLLKDNNWAPVARLGLEINSRASKIARRLQKCWQLQVPRVCSVSQLGFVQETETYGAE